MGTPQIAIIIVNWNGWRDTLECLESLKQVAYPNFSVYVVDNASTDESVTKLTGLQITDFRLQLIRNQENLGFSGGNNVGIRKALEDGADYILLLNNDTVVSADFLSQMVDAGESDPHIGIVGPKIYFDQITNDPQQMTDDKLKGSPAFAEDKFSAPQKIWFGGGKLNWLKTKGTHLSYDTVEKFQVSSFKFHDSDYITGCCLLIKAGVIKKIGLLSDDYFLYYEDVDWNLRANNAGYRIIYTPEAYIWHKVSRSTQAGSSNYIYYHVRNGLMLAWRFGGILRRPALIVFIFWLSFKQLIKLLVPSKRKWAAAVIRGIFDFFQGTYGAIRRNNI